jgi:hypothetical protein
VVGGRLAQVELEEDLADVGLDRSRADEESFADSFVGVALGHEGENFVLWQVYDLAWIYVVLDQERPGSALMA